MNAADTLEALVLMPTAFLQRSSQVGGGGGVNGPAMNTIGSVRKS
jgi:hypothetical protein